LRIVDSTWRLLERLERNNVHATLFFLGWVADRSPQLLRAAAALGHEIGCHSYWHHPVYRLAQEEFRNDTLRAKLAIESITGHAVFGYRAPSFSILGGMEWATDTLTELGFVYSSSSHPIAHDNYNNPHGLRLPYRTASGLWEIPISTWPLFGHNLPVGGGAYLRILPMQYILHGLKRVCRAGERMMIYMHPWEVDPGQPKLKAGMRSQLRQRLGIENRESRLQNLMDRYRFGTVQATFGSELDF
jgi:polysaccharide deacetylase family protein (PEP-CTERM system associated)